MDSPIPNDIKIAEEGESIRILGAWIGNHISPEDVWTKLIDRIEYELFLWENRHPDLIARRHILNTVLVSTTQYKTQVNGMPKEVLKRLTKVLNKFLWKGSAPMINMETLQKRIQDGGLGVTNLERRNKAILMMQLKQYLAFENRPTWAYVADAIMATKITAASGEIDCLAQINTFLQQWDVARSKLPPTINAMLKLAKDTNLRFSVLKPSKELVDKLPAWFHFGAKRFLKAASNSQAAKCLREIHKVKIMSDICRILDRRCQTPGQPMADRHYNSKNCKCPSCKTDRENGCRNPYKCCKTAENVRREVENSKWDPIQVPRPSDNLTLTRRRRTVNTIARAINEFITFDPSITIGR